MMCCLFCALCVCFLVACVVRAFFCARVLCVRVIPLRLLVRVLRVGCFCVLDDVCCCCVLCVECVLCVFELCVRVVCFIEFCVARSSASFAVCCFCARESDASVRCVCV